MIDLLKQERGDGGETVIRNNDIAMVRGYENQPYLAHFGGGNWIFNDLFLSNSPSAKFAAQTEQALLNNPLTSGGRIVIERAMNDDLEYMVENVPGTTVKITTNIDAVNRISGTVEIDGKTVAMNWNPDASFLNYSL